MNTVHHLKGQTATCEWLQVDATLQKTFANLHQSDILCSGLTEIWFPVSAIL